MSDEWFDATFWSSLLLGIFIIKQYVALFYESYIKIPKILSFLSFKNSSVTIGLMFFIRFYIWYHVIQYY